MLFRLSLFAPPATRVLILTFVAILAVTSVALAKGPYESEAESWTVSTYSPPDNLAMPRQNKNRWPRIVDHKRGLWATHAEVRVKCLKPELVELIRKVELKFGKKVVINSGYRSRAYNKRIKGARRSKHLTCEAADISVPGVSKYTLARYMRSLPGRGGVGTYCRSGFVHVDIGKKRDWHWRCRKRKRKSA